MNNKPDTGWFHFFSSTLDQLLLSELTSTDILIYLIIKKHANYKTGIAYPSINMMAKKTGMSERTISRSISALQKEKFLMVSKKKGKVSVYLTREKIDIGDKIAEWNYSPSTASDARNEIKNYYAGGKNETKIVQFIQNNIINNNITVEIKIEDKKIEDISDKKLREKVAKMIEKSSR